MDAIDRYYESLLESEKQVKRLSTLTALAALLAFSFLSSIHTTWLSPRFMRLREAQRTLRSLQARLVDLYGEKTLRSLAFEFIHDRDIDAAPLRNDESLKALIPFASADLSRKNTLDLLQHYREKEYWLWSSGDYQQFQAELASMRNHAVAHLTVHFVEWRPMPYGGDTLFGAWTALMQGPHQDIFQAVLDELPKKNQSSLLETANAAETLVASSRARLDGPLSFPRFLGDRDFNGVFSTVPLDVLTKLDQKDSDVLHSVLDAAGIASGEALGKAGLDRRDSVAGGLKKVEGALDRQMEDLASAQRIRDFTVPFVNITLPVKPLLILGPVVVLVLGLTQWSLARRLSVSQRARWRIVSESLPPELSRGRPSTELDPVPVAVWQLVAVSSVIAAVIGAGLVLHIFLLAFLQESFKGQVLAVVSACVFGLTVVYLGFRTGITASLPTLARGWGNVIARGRG